MIDEDVLRHLLADAAESAPAPGRAPDALLEAIAERPTTAAGRRPSRAAIFGVAAGLLVLLAGVGAFLDRPTPRLQQNRAALYDEGAATATTMAGSQAGPTAAGSVASADEGADRRARLEPGTEALAPGGGGGGSAGVAALTDTAKVIKTGSVDLEVPARAFEPTVERITSMAVGLGGYVAESITTESGDSPRGTITLRIPASSFDQLVLEVRKLGEVTAVTSKGTDVTAQFTDLAARLSALSATRDRLFEVLRGARNVGDIIAVQDRITGVQTEIEQIQGQQRLLEDQAGFGTLAVTLGEPGAERVQVEDEPDDGLGAAWDEARRRFGDSLEGLVAWSGSAAIVLLVGLVLAILTRLAWTRGRRFLV